MLTKGGQKAAAGTYWNLMNGERVDLAAEEMLPGARSTLYFKAPAALALAAGPVLGLIFAVFLPFIGIAMAMMLLVGKLIEGMTKATAGLVTFGWRPIEAYLAGRKRMKADERKKAKKTGAR